MKKECNSFVSCMNDSAIFDPDEHEKENRVDSFVSTNTDRKCSMVEQCHKTNSDDLSMTNTETNFFSSVQVEKTSLILFDEVHYDERRAIVFSIFY
jgi:hypothetical protein